MTHKNTSSNRSRKTPRQPYRPATVEEMEAAQAVCHAFPAMVASRLGIHLLFAAEDAVSAAEAGDSDVAGRLSNESIQRYTGIVRVLGRVTTRALHAGHCDDDGVITEDQAQARYWNEFLKELAREIAAAADGLSETCGIHNVALTVLPDGPIDDDQVETKIIRIAIRQQLKRFLRQLPPGASRDFLERLVARPELWDHLEHGRTKYVAEQLGESYTSYRKLLERLRKLLKGLGGSWDDDAA